ncbi:hypothetical protein [Bifidobacterium callimiconis]|uniref:Uncharacterized protein n=1 Tax=Bifidobacterium callimiconis TaxID=2306973 RepID=A0A430FDY0_9BIFI|nr:hypothetical protein [Bifidobacterium callimiconis]RSX51105.1 hypothetical protein D2E23_0950 [Bifidobacterium callimiconis]
MPTNTPNSTNAPNPTDSLADITAELPANPFAANAAKVPLFSADSVSTTELPKTSFADSSTTRSAKNHETEPDVPYTEEFRAGSSDESSFEAPIEPTIPIPGKTVRLTVDGDDKSGDNSPKQPTVMHTPAPNTGDINNQRNASVANALNAPDETETPSPWKTGISALTVTFGLLLLVIASLGFLTVYRFPEPIFSVHSGSFDAFLLAAVLAIAGLAIIAGVLIRTVRRNRE